MLLISMLLLINCDMFDTALIGELGRFYTKKLKVLSTWSTPMSRDFTRPPTTGDYGVPALQYHYDEDQESTKRSLHLEELEFEPVINPIPIIQEAGIDCDDFTGYAQNCTRDSAIVYNSSTKSPPMPAKVGRWCKAIRLLTNCAIDWNSECKDITESHFNEESIKGHMHVVNNICDDELFLAHYDTVPTCIDRVADAWEKCYVAFKHVVDFEKNQTQEWTHFATHFYLCCARTRFRHCTLDAVFTEPASSCPREEAVVLQKFSVIVSEGDVYQDCDQNMLYHNCPGGDPRPPTELLSKLMNAEGGDRSTRFNRGHPTTLRNSLFSFIVTVPCLIKLCM